MTLLVIFHRGAPRNDTSCSEDKVTVKILGEKKEQPKLYKNAVKKDQDQKIIFQMENCEEARDFKHCYTQCSAILLPIVSQRFSGIQYNQSDLARNTLD